jgi:hypothetical protein
VRRDRARTLTKFTLESDELFELRANGGVLFNAFQETVRSMTSLLLSDPVRLGDGLPDVLRQHWEALDSAGRHADVFLHDAVLDAMLVGTAGILVDAPPRPAELDDRVLSAEEELRFRLRPYWHWYTAEQIVTTHYHQRDGQVVLTLVVLREDVPVPVGLFAEGVRTQYRVYRLDTTAGVPIVRWEVWVQPKPGAPFAIDTQGTVSNVTRIPFVPLALGRGAHPVYREPVFQNLADINLRHWRTDVAHHWNLHMQAYGVAVRVGAERDPQTGEYPPLRLGPTSKVDVPIGGSFTFVGPPDSAYAHQRLSMRDDETRMGTLGLQFLSPDTRQAETATAKKLDQRSANANIRVVAQRVRDAVETALKFHCEMLRLDPEMAEVAFRLDLDAQGLDPALLSALSTLEERGQLTLRTLLRTVQLGRLPDDFDADDEVDAVSDAKAEAAFRAVTAGLGAENRSSSDDDGADDGAGADA